VCIHAHPQIPKSKGARYPIHDSGEFRVCMQIDLIDYFSNERRNVYGQVMRWIMFVKDHFTGLCYLRAIPKKNAKYVCFELNSLFGLIGYQHIEANKTA
jgi:phenolic acid decarboxylase